MSNRLILHYLFALLRENLFHSARIERKVNKIMATQQEEATALAAVRDQLAKATAEIVTKIDALTAAVAASGATSPEVDAATADLKAAAQKLDDVVPDVVPTP
jgi:septal ring factor EnvC (AmiA/AmiB activator)